MVDAIMGRELAPYISAVIVGFIVHFGLSYLGLNGSVSMLLGLLAALWVGFVLETFGQKGAQWEWAIAGVVFTILGLVDAVIMVGHCVVVPLPGAEADPTGACVRDAMGNLLTVLELVGVSSLGIGCLICGLVVWLSTPKR